MYDLCLFKEIMYICICIWFYMSVVMFRLFFYVILIYKNCWLKIELYLVVKKKKYIKNLECRFWLFGWCLILNIIFYM